MNGFDRIFAPCDYNDFYGNPYFNKWDNGSYSISNVSFTPGLYVEFLFLFCLWTVHRTVHSHECGGYNCTVHTPFFSRCRGYTFSCVKKMRLGDVDGG